MTKKISFFVVTVAAVALVLSGCSRGPGMDDMEPDDMATVLPHIGTWYLRRFARSCMQLIKLSGAERSRSRN